MKRIAVLLFEVFNNLGGILPSTYHTCKGLEEAGYEPFIFHAEWKDRKYDRPEGSYKNVGFGLRTSTSKGLERIRMFASPKHTFLYRGRSCARDLRDALSEYDGVILSSSIPSIAAKKMGGNNDWKIVLQHGKPMIGMVRDCHWSRLSPHIFPYRHLFQAFVGVHPAAFNSLKNMPWKIACQPNPHDTSLYGREYEKNWEEVCITSWFKQWKHIDDALRAVPYMKPIRLRIAGGGIEHSYMEAAKKNPDRPREDFNLESTYRSWQNKMRFYSWKENDKSVRDKWIGKSIWEVAERSGNFTYEGFLLQGRQLDDLQSECGGLFDPSYHYDWGEHFNRTMIEAILHHSIPFMRPYGISDNAEGQGKIFGPDNAVMIPETASPKRIGEIIRSSMNDRKLKRDLKAANAEKVQMFNRTYVARQYIKLLEGKEAGLFGIQEGKLDEKTLFRLNKLGLIRRFPRTFRFPR